MGSGTDLNRKIREWESEEKGNMAIISRFSA